MFPHNYAIVDFQGLYFNESNGINHNNLIYSYLFNLSNKSVIHLKLNYENVFNLKSLICKINDKDCTYINKICIFFDMYN